MDEFNSGMVLSKETALTLIRHSVVDIAQIELFETVGISAVPLNDFLELPRLIAESIGLAVKSSGGLEVGQPIVGAFLKLGAWLSLKIVNSGSFPVHNLERDKFYKDIALDQRIVRLYEFLHFQAAEVLASGGYDLEHHFEA